jgi:hypothetical protein
VEVRLQKKLGTKQDGKRVEANQKKNAVLGRKQCGCHRRRGLSLSLCKATPTTAMQKEKALSFVQLHRAHLLFFSSFLASAASGSSIIFVCVLACIMIACKKET